MIRIDRYGVNEKAAVASGFSLAFPALDQ